MTSREYIFLRESRMYKARIIYISCCINKNLKHANPKRVKMRLLSHFLISIARLKNTFY